MANLHDPDELERLLADEHLEPDVRGRLTIRLEELRRRDAKTKAESERFDSATEHERRRWLAANVPHDPFAD